MLFRSEPMPSETTAAEAPAIERPATELPAATPQAEPMVAEAQPEAAATVATAEAGAVTETVAGGAQDNAPAAGEDGPSRITVRATSNSWIQVRDEALDRLLFTRLLRAGDQYEVPNRPGLSLMTGNAGALELLVDGKVAPAIGVIGEVRRDVQLDPDKLLAGD